MRIIELFAGIGACSTALKRIGVDLEIVDAVEIDKYAMASFNAIHGTNFEPQDITTWNKELKDIDLITHGSPCQDFSVAGKQAGGDLGSGTRSSLMYETIRIVGQVRPKYVLWENVKNILSKKHKHNFDAYIETMNVLGYNSYYQVLNAKDYGIPQNRERVYTISIRKDVLVYDDYNSKIRKDQETIGTLTTNCGSSSKRNGWKIIETNESFTFPEKEPLKLRLKDMLEDEVDEKYYLKDSSIKNLQRSFGSKAKEVQEDGICDTLQAAMGNGGGNVPVLKTVGNLYGGKWDKINEICRRVYGEEGISPTIHTCQGGNTEPKIMTIGNYMPSGHDASRVVHNEGIAPTVKENHGTVTATIINKNDKPQKDSAQNRVSPTLTDMQRENRQPKIVEDFYKSRPARKYEEVAPTLRSERIGLKVVEPKIYERTPLKFLNRNQKNIEGDYAFCVDSSNTGGIKEIENNNYRIRKLTPKECWRLMGFSDEDFEKAQNIPTSNTQLYKQAGNSIVVDVLVRIFRNLLEVS